ncbi:DUF7507 domain-containing protein [Romboutsia lituseburensis]|uniref:Conserved repeat domain-containing protein n=1 Tax=Romboutsia lituseburensis DSM 797 TaxID=1121325 RepID=A0A1G9S2E4_9FIRM|nr:DUF11 domain-containing protein [Romboutsia lituseburensis]CEH32906.1 Conserved repeat domain protein [Romboutsia lituseburensis]SDM29646.1 conserved repeat domain-containing protein [Romboutsia lituseburensis DSM 797]
MALTQRFSAIDKAILVATGNSLVVCGSTTAPAVNTSDIIKIDGTTTRDWTESGSTANLNILANSTILYAELVWYSTVYSNVSGALDLRSIQDNPITFTTSKGNFQITPQYSESYTGLSGTIDRYRAADVTSYIQSALSGSYTVSNVPISVPSTGLSNSRAGWSLSVIYRNNAFKPQKVIYNSGISVATPNTPLQTTLTGFTTSSDQSSLKGNVFLACANGGPIDGIETVMAGPSFAQLSNIGNVVNSPNPNPGTSPNNPGNNFFSGAINVADPLNSSNGLLNINGTNGNNNNDGFVPTQKLGARNKWDITNVDISNTLVTNQTLLAGQITEGQTGDGVQLVALGAQVLAKAPNIIATLDSYDIDGDNEYNVEVGEPLVYAIHIKNDGDVPANNVIASAALNSSTTFVPGSVTINGVSNPTADIQNGINTGTIAAKGIVTVLFTVMVNSVPSGGLMYQSVNYNYQFVSGLDTITNYGQTNTVEVIVQDGKLKIIKSASKTTMNINDIVDYTINITNIGTEIAKNLFFQDKIDPSSSFVSGTVVIDGTAYLDYDPVAGFSLPDLPVGGSTQIVFKFKVNSLPASTKVNNISCITFSYIFNQYGYSREKTTFSNSTVIQVQYIDIIGERCNNNNYPNVGDTVTYTLSLTNIGNEPAPDIQVIEPPIPGATFVSGSVKINGTIKPTLNPFDGFILPDPIGPQQTTNVEYKVLVNSINPADLIENIAQVPFKYQISPGGTVIESEKDSNKVDTVANYVCMNVTKCVDKQYAEIGNTLYYKIEISNSGNINAINTVFLDTIQPEASFVPGSVAINGISYPSYDPNQGFTLGTICYGDIIEVTFQAKVNTLPNPNIIYNKSNLVYSYKPDPNGSTLTNTIYSNTVQTTINKAQYTVVKSVDKTYAQVGDALVYTTTIQNTGTVPLTNMKFVDFLGIYLEFYQGSLYINGINYPNLTPNIQFPIDDMQPGETTTIVFGATIKDNPPVGYIPNTSEVTMTYKQSPDSPVITKTIYSNTVITYDPYAQINLVKTADKSYAAVGETLTYSFTATNTGNTAAINTLFADIIQSEASFVPGSVLVNGVSKPDYNPQTGFTLGTMQMGQVVTIEFKVTVNSLPVPNTIKNNATISFIYYVDPTQQPVTKTSTSNTVTTVINSYSATLTKSVDKMYATIGDVLHYTVTATNTGTIPLTNVNFKDIIQNGATFVSGSVVVDGTSYPNYNPNTGFTISNVLPGGNVVVMFSATVTSVPVPPKIDNTANITFKYQLSPTSPYIDGSLTSNTVTTNINKMAVTNTKSVNKAYATVGDTLTYTSVIANNGNVNISNTQFIDTVPEHTTFVAGTVKIDGTSYSDYDPNLGFTVGVITPGSHVTVTFDVTVDSVPSNGYITNTSILNYQYKIDPNGPYILGSSTSNTVTTYINLGDLTVTKSADRSVVRLTNVITYSFVINNTGNTVLKNLLFKDTIQSESSFNTGTVYVNGINKPNYNPNTGFSLDDIPVGQQAVVSFQVTANTLPTDNKLLNKADVTYSYYVDPNGNPTTKTKTSNTTTVYVYDTIVSANKSVDKTLAKIGDTLNFTITIKNEGNTSAQHVFFEDILDSHISFVPDSVYINQVQMQGYNPNTGFDLDDIIAGATTTVSFAATILSRPSDNIIYNYATIAYDYTVGQEIITAAINTNTTQTYVAAGELTVNKSVDKLYATVGDNIAYTVVVKNTGSVNATNITFKDLIPQSTSFNTGTVAIDGTPQPTFNPNTGFALSDLIPNQYHTITFSIHVDSLPQSEKVENTADITFTYKLTPTDNPVTITTNSNTVTTIIKIGILTATKLVDKAYATIGDTLNYTINIINSGNANCFDVFFRDIVQSNASFIAGSVKINGVTYVDYDPNTGFNLNDITGYGNSTVTFAVKVLTLPTDYTIYNHATGSYKYYVDPANQPVVKEGTTNTVTTIINVGSLTATKSVSKAYATIDDVLTYTVNVVNTGNTLAKNVNFRDVIPNGLTFVNGSVTINGVNYPTYDPYSSFSLGNIVSGDTVIVKFNAAVTSLPVPSLVSNTANLSFVYRIDPNGSDIPAQVNSNTVTTQINVGSISLNKSVDKSYATMGDTLTYTVVVTNNGNVRADNVIFTDSLQTDVTFNEGSVKVNGTTYPDYNPNLGFSLGNIDPLDHVTVVFTVNIIDSPTHQSVLNYAVGTFSYKVDPNGQYYSKSTQSNTVSTIIVMPKLTATKTVDKMYATLQDILSYGILIKNDGNTTISQLFFTDFLSNGAVFKSGTVIIDGVSYPNYDPIQGFNLPNNLIAGNTCLVQFQATVATLPSPPQITNYAVSNGLYRIDPQGSTYPITATSNTVTTNINVGSLSNTKTVDKMYAKVNDTVTYTSTIINTGNVNATSLFFTDILQSALTYISGTVSINGIVYPALDPTVGFELSNLAPGQTVTVAFNAKINSLPTPAYVTNNSNIQFSYKIDPSGAVITKDQLSNTVTTNVVLGKITVVKSVDKPIATIGDELTYTVTLTNVGNVIDSKVFFQDTPSTGVTFKPGSVKVNNVSQPTYNPTVGFSLGDIGIGNVVTVSFVVTVVSVPSTNQVTNQAVITFEYVVDPKQPPYSDTTYSNTVTTNIAYGSLNVTKSVNKKYATIGEQLTYTVTIVNTGNIDATNVVFLDQTPHNSVFVLGSVTINGVSYPDYNPSAGFNLNTMTPGQIITVVYKVQVVDLC